jgi:nicotinic acid mononucleotide adenylyltransferase
MNEDKAKQAAQAREQLRAAMLDAANALIAASERVAVLAAAIEREDVATTAYVVELERQLSHQKALS